MSLISRIANAFRPDCVNRDLDEELQSHLDEAAEHGRDPAEARRAFGSVLRQREASREFKLITWLDALRADVVFGWRQLLKHKIPSAAAVLSLALAIGACVSAFRLVDALLLRPLPVASPERLYVLTYEVKDFAGKPDIGDSFEYPHFRRLRDAVKDQAELMAIANANRIDLTYGSDREMEKAYCQYVSGWTFRAFGLKPLLGRLLTSNDDVTPGAHPRAVLSYDYWQRRFGRDPKAVGRFFRLGNDSFEIVGVLELGFTGTETGTLTDVFVPIMMNKAAIEDLGWSWFRTWVQVRPGHSPDVVRQQLQAASRAFREEKAKTFTGGQSQRTIEQYVNAPQFLEAASAGVSGLQKKYRQPLAILGVLVALVLLIACANVANLMAAQAAARAREMALRVSIGAGRWRLVQLVLVESVLVALLASALGGLFTWWAAPFVVGAINPPGNPARLLLPADWRVAGFAVLLTLVVAVLFGLMPAWRASAVKPVSALKGGEDPHARRRLMNVLVAVQVAFCFFVHFTAGLFVTTFDRLSHQPTGFASERLLILEAVVEAEQPTAHWDQVVDQLRSVRGVESVGLSVWPLMSGNGWINVVSINGPPREDIQPYLLRVSPGWLATMKIPMIGGRDFRVDDPYPGKAIVNESFAQAFFEGKNPVGKSFARPVDGKKPSQFEIVGYVRDARYRNMREAIRPTAYFPFRFGNGKSDWGRFIVRTASQDPLAMAQLLRQEVSRARSEFRVSNVNTQVELVRSHTLRERLLAMLALFFASVALVLAAVGLFGVLEFSVQQRRREIGIRMALGAQSFDVVRRVTVEVFSMVLIGAAAGLATGVASERYLETLLYQVKATDVTMLTLPAVTIFAAAMLAALPPVIRAVRIDPARMLRAD